MFVYNRLRFAADCHAIAEEFPYLETRLANLVLAAYNNNDRIAVERLEKLSVTAQLPVVAALAQLGNEHDVADAVHGLIMDVMHTTDAAGLRLEVTNAELEIASGITKNGFATASSPNKILAIKVYRERTGADLKDGKNAIENALIERHGCHEIEALNRMRVSTNTN